MKCSRGLKDGSISSARDGSTHCVLLGGLRVGKERLLQRVHPPNDRGEAGGCEETRLVLGISLVGSQ